MALLRNLFATLHKPTPPMARTVGARNSRRSGSAVVAGKARASAGGSLMRPWGSAGEKFRLAPSTARRAWGPLQPHVVDEERDVVVGNGRPGWCAEYAARHRVI